MEDRPLYKGYGWQSNLATFVRSEARVVRLQLQQFVADASPAQVRAWDRDIPWLQRECRELEVRDISARKYTAILEYELPRDSRRPDVIVLEPGCVAVLELKGASAPRVRRSSRRSARAVGGRVWAVDGPRRGHR